MKTFTQHCFYYYLILLISVLACSKKDGDITPNLLEGHSWRPVKWTEVTKGREIDITSQIDDCEKSATWVFASEKLTLTPLRSCYEYYDVEGPIITTYTLKANKLTIGDKTSDSVVVTATFSGKSMILLEEDSGDKVIFER